MKYIVYLTVNNKNGKIYVGVHKTATPYRFDGYFGCGVKQTAKIKSPKFAFHHAFNKYGASAFTRHTLFVFDKEDDAYAREAEMVTIEFVRSSRTYNTALGGGSGAGLHSNKEVHCYSASDGKYIKSYPSMSDASRDVGLKGVGAIVSCLNNLSRTGQGYFWYHEKVDVFIPTTEANETIVHKYSLTGRYLSTYPTLKKAAESVGKENTSPISQCLTGARNKAYGFVWEYIKKEGRGKIVKENYKAPVHQYDAVTGEFIESFCSAKDAAIKLGKSIRGNITSCTAGKRKTAGGFNWSYDKLNKIVI